MCVCVCVVRPLHLNMTGGPVIKAWTGGRSPRDWSVCVHAGPSHGGRAEAGGWGCMGGGTKGSIPRGLSLDVLEKGYNTLTKYWALGTNKQTNKHCTSCHTTL